MARRLTAMLDAGATKKIALAIHCQTIGGDSLGETEAERKWVQIATEDQFLGYRGGDRPFQFTRETFEQAIANVRAHPSFQAGADGIGQVDVIPWDFNHASEQDPTQGSLPFVGAPAQAWSSDLKIVAGPDGKAQLWAFTRFLEPARGYVKAGQYKWASVALTFNSIDPKSANNVGALITSIALTNTPFIEGMQGLIAASNSSTELHGEVLAMQRHFFEAAQTPADAFDNLKQLFGLPETADASVLMTEIAKVRQWIESGTTPVGIKTDEIVGSMRIILGLPTLTPALEVLDSTNEIIQRLIEEAAGVATPPTPAEPAPEAAAASRRYEMELIKILAGKLGARDNEDAVRAAVEELVTLREALVKLFKLNSRDATGVVLEAAESQVGAREKLSALLKALGVEDVDGGIEHITTLITQAEELKTAMPELEGLRTKAKAADEKSAETDVAEAMAAHKVPDAAHDAMLLMRTSNPEKFVEKFPKPDKSVAPAASTPGVTASHVAALTSSVAATPGGQELRLNADGTGVAVAQVPPGAPKDGGIVNLSIYDGANNTQKAMTYLARTMDGWDKMTHDERFKAAIALKRSSHVTYQPVQ